MFLKSKMFWAVAVGYSGLMTLVHYGHVPMWFLALALGPLMVEATRRWWDE